MPYTVLGSFDRLFEDMRLTDRQREVSRQRINHLQSFFEGRYLLARKPWAIGSFGRETLVRWERDIDVMVALDDFYWPTRRSDSASFLRWIRDALNEEYLNTRVSTRQVAVRMALGEGLEVDLVPTFVHDYGGFLMPDGEGGWRRTNPPFHDELMERANVRLGSRLKPLVRLMKAWNLCSGAHLSSFHTELLVEAAWRSAWSIPPWPVAVADSLERMQDGLAASMPDPWPSAESGVDRELTSTGRSLASTSMAVDLAIARVAIGQAAAGDEKGAIQSWSVIFVDRFPTYG